MERLPYGGLFVLYSSLSQELLKNQVKVWADLRDVTYF